MTPMRLVLVTRRFWPLIGGAERVMAELAHALQEQGANVTILTAQWERSWPREIVHRGVRVVRLPQPSLRFWGTWRYMRELNRWLTEHRSEFDLVYVSMLKHDAYVAVGAGKRLGFPVALRAEGPGLTGDVHWQLRNRFGWRIRNQCYKADAVIGPSPIIHRELIAAGYPRDRAHYLPNAVPLPKRPSAEIKTASRTALADAHPLMSAGEAPVALYAGRLHEAKGLADLVNAWAIVSERRPDARLWLAGEGPLRDALFRQVADLGLDGRVVLCGAFDAVDELLAAADTFVLPSYEEGMSLALLEAMAAGVPVIASDIPANRELIEPDRNGLLVPTRDPNALGTAILRLWDGPAFAKSLAEAARERVEREFALPIRAKEHLDLFERLIARRSSRESS